MVWLTSLAANHGGDDLAYEHAAGQEHSEAGRKGLGSRAGVTWTPRHEVGGYGKDPGAPCGSHQLMNQPDTG